MDTMTEPWDKTAARLFLAACLFAATYPLVCEVFGEIEALSGEEPEGVQQILWRLCWILVAWVIFHAAFGLLLFGGIDMTFGGLLL